MTTISQQLAGIDIHVHRHIIRTMMLSATVSNIVKTMDILAIVVAPAPEKRNYSNLHISLQ